MLRHSDRIFEILAKEGSPKGIFAPLVARGTYKDEHRADGERRVEGPEDDEQEKEEGEQEKPIALACSQECRFRKGEGRGHRRHDPLSGYHRRYLRWRDGSCVVEERQP